MTGAEFLQADRTFAIGYLTGVIDVRLTVIHSDDPHFTAIRNCVAAAKLTNDTFYNIISTRLQAHPEELSSPALGAIFNVLSEMCVKN